MVGSDDTEGEEGPKRGTTRVAQSPRVGLFGCPLDTGNNGVAALGLSTLRGILESAPDARVTVFDHGRGIRDQELRIGQQSVSIRFAGCAHSRRYYRTSNLTQMYLASWLGMKRAHPMLRRLGDLDLVLSMSGGDSFSDLYGDWRFRAVTLPKLIALEMGLPLVLPPQTYGPYREDHTRRVASRILGQSHAVWARDQNSLEIARDVTGPGCDPARFHLGVDVAFGLPAREPEDSSFREDLDAFRGRFDLLAGLNVSGLLYNEPGADQSRHGFKSPYRETIRVLLDRLLALEGVGVVMIPHVVSAGRGSADCDATACAMIRKGLPRDQDRRVLFAPDTLGAMEAKWVASQLDWLCGTRMHACIAAISQGIPTAAIAYSDKTLGVFETVGVGDCVADARQLDGPALIERIMAGLGDREASAKALADGLPNVKRRLGEQFQSILSSVGA